MEDCTENYRSSWQNLLHKNDTQILFLNSNTLILITPDKLQWAADCGYLSLGWEKLSVQKTKAGKGKKVTSEGRVRALPLSALFCWKLAHLDFLMTIADKEKVLLEKL